MTGSVISATCEGVPGQTAKLMRDGEAATHLAHNQATVGSSPAPATGTNRDPYQSREEYRRSLYRWWRFKNHGETGLVYREVSRDGDDLDLADERGRRLKRVPVEFLEQVKS